MVLPLKKLSLIKNPAEKPLPYLHIWLLYTDTLFICRSVSLFSFSFYLYIYLSIHILYLSLFCLYMFPKEKRLHFVIQAVLSYLQS